MTSIARLIPLTKSGSPLVVCQTSPDGQVSGKTPAFDIISKPVTIGNSPEDDIRIYDNLTENEEQLRLEVLIRADSDQSAKFFVRRLTGGQFLLNDCFIPQELGDRLIEIVNNDRLTVFGTTLVFNRRKLGVLSKPKENVGPEETLSTEVTPNNVFKVPKILSKRLTIESETSDKVEQIMEDMWSSDLSIMHKETRNVSAKKEQVCDSQQMDDEVVEDEESSQKDVEYEVEKIEDLNEIEREKLKTTEAETQMKAYEKKVNDLNQQLDDARDQFGKEYEKYENKINQMNRDIVELRNQLNDCLASQESTEAQLKAANEKLLQSIQLDVESTELRNRLQKWEEVMGCDSPLRVSGHLNQLQATELQLRTELAQLNTQLNEFRTEKNRLETELQSTSHKLEEQNKTLNKMEEKCLLLAKERDSYKNMISSYNEQDITLNWNILTDNGVEQLEDVIEENNRQTIESETSDKIEEHNVKAKDAKEDEKDRIMNEVESGISDSVVSKQQVRDSPQSDDKLVKTRRASKRTVNAKDEKLDVVIDEVGRRRSRAVTRVKAEDAKENQVMNEVKGGITDSSVSKQQVHDTPQVDDKVVNTRTASKRKVNAKDEKLDEVKAKEKTKLIATRGKRVRFDSSKDSSTEPNDEQPKERVTRSRVKKLNEEEPVKEKVNLKNDNKKTQKVNKTTTKTTAKSEPKTRSTKAKESSPPSTRRVTRSRRK